MKPKVFLTRRMPPAVMERLERETDLAWHAEDRVATKTEIIAGMKGRDALLCNILDRVDAELLDSCPGLKVVANFGVGFNNIDVAAATARKIPVTNTPGVLTDTTADMAFTLMLADTWPACPSLRTGTAWAIAPPNSCAGTPLPWRPAASPSCACSPPWRASPGRRALHTHKEYAPSSGSAMCARSPTLFSSNFTTAYRTSPAP